MAIFKLGLCKNMCNETKTIVFIIMPEGLRVNGLA